MIPHLGEILALSTAIIWALGVVLFKKSGESLNPISLNLFKNSLAFILYPLTLAIAGKSIWHEAPLFDYGLLFFSGILGMAISDTYFFKSLNILGASRDAIVSCLYSPFIILFSVLFLKESLTLLQLIGVLCIVAGVLTIGREKGKHALPRKELIKGILYGVFAMALTAISIVMIKPLLERSPIFWAIEVRLTGAIIVLFLFSLFRKDRYIIFRGLLPGKGYRYTISGSFFGTYLALIFWLGGMKYTQASTASALNQTSNIFVFLFAAVLLKEAITRQKIMGIILGVAGVFIVTFGGGFVWP